MKKCVLLLIRPKLNKSGSVGYLLLFRVNMTNTVLWALETQIWAIMIPATGSGRL
jgi:hypothetical protein